MSDSWENGSDPLKGAHKWLVGAIVSPVIVGVVLLWFSENPATSATVESAANALDKREIANGWAGKNPGDYKFIQIGNQVILLIWCPPGSFMMGSPKDEFFRSNHEDQVKVMLSKGFWMMATEVT